jgi:TPR repeat protein
MVELTTIFFLQKSCRNVIFALDCNATNTSLSPVLVTISRSIRPGLRFMMVIAQAYPGEGGFGDITDRYRWYIALIVTVVALVTANMNVITAQMQRLLNSNMLNSNTMSADFEEVADIMKMYCASCGTAEIDDVKLKQCPDCDLVRYCSKKCQEDHRPEHKRECKERVAELRDEILFTQPKSTHLGDCPICFLPLPIDVDKSNFQACCSKTICLGCFYTNRERQVEQRLQETCPFCRHPVPASKEEFDRNKMKRVEKNDRVAIRELGTACSIEEDDESAFEYWTKAAELGDVDAQHFLSCSYLAGLGVEKDEKKQVYHAEEAAIAGHPLARHNLAVYEGNNGRIDRAVKHLIIGANLGHDDSIQALKQYYVHGFVSKDDFAAALRAHQAAVDATKSQQREEAAKAFAAGEISFCAGKEARHKKFK